MQIHNTNQLAMYAWLKLIVFGPSGSGKTQLIRTAPNPIILSAEAGLIGLRNYNIDYIIIKSMAELLDAWRWATTSKEAAKYDTICLDSISEIAELLLAEEKPKHKNAMQAYGQVQERILAAIRAFRDIPNKHVYFSAKQEFVIDLSTGQRIAYPMFPGKVLPQQVPYLFDEVYHIESYPDKDGIPQYYLRTVRDNNTEAKSRVNCLSQWEPAHLGNLFEKIKKG